MVRVVARALAVALFALALVDAAVRAAFPVFPRLESDFSATYLMRDVERLTHGSPIVVLGDSALWGYGVAPDQTAVVRLDAGRGRWADLAYEGGSPANTFAMLRLLTDAGVAPRAIVFNVNLKEFNALDSAYRRLSPALETLVWARLAAPQRARLAPVLAQSPDARLDRAVAALWQTYGLRADLRDALFGAPDAAHALANALAQADGTARRKAAAHRPSAARFEGTYDLAPLDDGNVSVYFLRAIAALVRTRRTPAYAILTPTNHGLLHAYVDGPEYREQLAFVRRLLRANGVHVLEYDAAFAPEAFLDNDHLTVDGNRELARRLARDVRP